MKKIVAVLVGLYLISNTFSLKGNLLVTKKHYRTPKNIQVNNLALVKLLQKVKEDLVILTQEKKLSQEVCVAHTLFVEDTLNLLRGIVDDFKRKLASDNPLLLYKFIALVQLPYDINDITPCDIRLIRKKINKYRTSIKDYYLKHQQSISEKETDFLNKLIRLNDQLLHGVLKEEFLNISSQAQLADAFIHRPWHFIKKHKLLVGTVSITALAAFMYFYGLPWLQKRYPSGEVSVHQLSVLDQHGNQCPFHALFNTWCMMNGKDEAFMQSRKEYEKKYNQWRAILGKSDELDAEELRKLIGISGFKNMDDVTVMRSLDALSQTGSFKKVHAIERLKRLKGQNCLGFFEADRNKGKKFKETLKSHQWNDLYAYAQDNGIDISFMKNKDDAYELLDNAHFIEAFNAEAEQRGFRAPFKSNGTFYEKLSRLKNSGNPQYVVANLSSRPSYQPGSDPIGHWVALKLDKNNDTLAITAANSLGNGDIKHHQVIEHLHKLYKQVE